MNYIEIFPGLSYNDGYKVHLVILLIVVILIVIAIRKKNSRNK